MISPELLAVLRDRYVPGQLPRCAVCGAETDIVAIRQNRSLLACSTTDYFSDREHYEASRIELVNTGDELVNTGDELVIELLDACEAMLKKMKGKDLISALMIVVEEGEENTIRVDWLDQAGVRQETTIVMTAGHRRGTHNRELEVRVNGVVVAIIPAKQ